MLFLSILFSMTIRFVTVADHLPDQDVLRSSQQVPLPASTESAMRPIIWDSEDMAIDETCETSFQSYKKGTPEPEASSNLESASQRRPIGQLDASGQIVDLDMEAEQRRTSKGKGRMSDEGYAPSRRATIQYGLPPDNFDADETQVLSVTEQLQLAGVSIPVVALLDIS